MQIIDKVLLQDIQLPSNIDIKPSDNGSIKMHIENPHKNMQIDDAAFEAWSLILRSKGIDNIQLSFRIEDHWSPENGLKYKECSNDKKYYKSEKMHFNRFLFRLWKFQESMEWFLVEPGECTTILNLFKKEFLTTKTINNVPNSKPGISSSTKKKEHHIENVFSKISKAKRYITPNMPTLPHVLNNQLPCGLFQNRVGEVNRIFPTGFFDLWGVGPDKNHLWLFELKDKDNKAAGIISELFFYANYASHVFQSSNYNNKANKNKDKDRGYSLLLKSAENGISKIHACFLSPYYHRQISKHRKTIVKLLNEGQEKIKYIFFEYNHEAIYKLIETIK